MASSAHKLIPSDPEKVLVTRSVTPDIKTFSTPFLRFGDTIRIEMKNATGHSVFGAIEQTVTALDREP